MVLPVKCTTPNSIRAKNPRRGLLRIFSANLQRRKWRLFFRFYLLHNGGHRSKSESTGPLWVRVRGLLWEDKTTFFLTLGLCYAWQLAAGRSLLSFPIKRTLKTKGRLINRAEVDSSVSRVAWEMQGKNEFFQKVFQ